MHSVISCLLIFLLNGGEKVTKDIKRQQFIEFHEDNIGPFWNVYSGPKNLSIAWESMRCSQNHHLDSSEMQVQEAYGGIPLTGYSHHCPEHN